MRLSLGEVYKSLDEDGLRVLLAVESGLTRYLFVPVRYILRKTGLNPKLLDRKLEELVEKRLLARKVGAEVGYTLTMLGLDVLALNSLVNRGLVEAVGERIDVGKEADIYEVISPGGARLALKLFRIGRTSFRQTARFRPYVELRELHSWLDESKLSAEREYKALTKLSVLTDKVPKPVGYSRHAVLIEFIEGEELYKVRALSRPEGFLRGVLEVIKVAYVDAGIVHGDLSEYNILVSYPEERPVVIDWPQYVYREHPSALKLLKRDVLYVCRYFEKRFGVRADPEAVLRNLGQASREFRGGAGGDESL